jgi:phage-related minor tail protein
MEQIEVGKLKVDHSEVDAATRSVEKHSKTLQILRGQAVELEKGVVKLGTGFTKMQAGQLAMLQMAGATKTQMQALAKTFEQFNAMAGKNPFDKSASGLARMKQDVKDLENVNKLMSKGYNLTKDQVIELAREHTRLTQVYAEEGKSSEALRRAIGRLTTEYVETAGVKNKLLAQADESTRKAKEEARTIKQAKAEELKAIKQAKAEEAKLIKENEKILKQAKAEEAKLIKENEKILKQAKAEELKATKELEKARKAVIAEEVRLTKQALAEELKERNKLEKEWNKAADDHVKTLRDKMQLEATTGDAMVAQYYKNEEKKIKATEKRIAAEAKALQEAERALKARNDAELKSAWKKALAEEETIRKEAEKDRKQLEKEWNKAADDHAASLKNKMQLEATAGDAMVAQYYQNEQKKIKAVEKRIEAEAKSDEAQKQMAAVQIGPTRAMYEKATKEAGKAVDYLVQAEQRLDAALDRTNAGLNERSTDQLVAYQKALKQSGLSADVAGAKFDTFKKKLDQVAAKERADELRYLSRAISVQMGDVAISLASGMNPLLVMIQQGDQIRGVLDQTGAKGKELTTAMNAAAAQIASGFKNTAFAITSFMGGALAYLGKSLLEPINAYKRLAEAKKLFETDIEGMSNLRKSRLQTVANLELAKSLGTFAKIAGGVAVAALTAYGIALYQVSKQEEELNKAVNLTGGSIGMTAQIASDMAKELAGARGNIASFSEAITEAAKAGSVTQQNLEAVTSAAVLLKDEAGIAIADTVKEFSKLSEKPTDSLRELAKTTGMIAPEILQVVATLEQQGMKAEAAAIAVRAYSDAMKNSVGNLVAERGALETFFHAISAGAKSMWDSILNVGRKGSIVEQLKNAQGDLAKRVQEGASWYQTEAAYKEELAYLKEIVDSHQLTIDKEKEKGDVKRKNTEYSEWEIKNSNALQKSLTKEQQFAIKQAELERDVAKGIISQAKAAEALVGWKKIILGDDKKAKEDPLLKYLGKTEEKVRDLGITVKSEYQEMLEATSGLSKAEKLRLDILDDPQWKQLDASAKFRVLQALSETDAKEKLIAIEKKRIADSDIILKGLVDSAKAYENVTENIKQQDAALQNQVKDLEFQYSILGKSSDEQEKLTEEYKKQQAILAVNVKLAETEANIKKNITDPEDYADALGKAQKVAAGEIDLINKESAIKAAKAYIDEFNKISSGITDSIVTALFEGGKAGRKKLRDMLVEAIRKPITTYVNVVVNEIFGTGINLLLQAIGMQTGGSAGSLMNGVTGAASMYNAATSLTGAAGLGSIASGATYGTSAMSSQSIALAMQEAGFSTTAIGTTTGSSATGGGAGMTGASYAAGAVAGHYAGRAISNGYSAMGGSSGNTAVNLGTAIGAVIAGPIGAAVGGALGGLTNRAFGSKTTTGIQGTFGGASGFEGQEYTDKKYGFLRFKGNTTSLSALDESERQAIANDFNLIKAGVLDTAKTLGVGANALDGFTKEIRQSLADPEAYKGILDELTEGLASTALNSLGDWKKFQKEGEKSSSTLKRLSDVIGNTNQVFEDLGWKLNEFSLAGYSAAENFIAALGGLDAANSKLSKYYQNFYSEQERVTNYIEKGTDAFAKLGITFPKSMSEFRTLVTEQQKLGNTQVVADLMNLQDYVIGSYAQMSDGIIEEVNRIRNIAAADSKGNSLAVLMAQFNKSGSVEDSKALLDFAESNVGSLLELQRLRAGVINKLLGNSDMQAAAPEVLNSAPVASSSAGSSISESVTNSSSDLQAVVEALKEEIVNLRYEMQANVSWTSKTAKILERVTPDGDAIATRVAT